MINGSHHMRKSATTSGILYNLALSNLFMTGPATLFANNEAEASSFFKQSPMKMVLTLKLPSTLKTNRDTLDQDINHTARLTSQLGMNAHENSAKYTVYMWAWRFMPYLCSTKLLYHNLPWVYQIKCAFSQSWHSWPYIRAQLLWYWPTRYCSPTNACNLMLYLNISCQRPRNDENRIAHTLLRLDQCKCHAVIYNKQ